jgi:hypothetical protein
VHKYTRVLPLSCSVCVMLGMAILVLVVPLTQAGPVRCSGQVDGRTLPCCEICGPDLVCPGQTEIIYTVHECSEPPIEGVTFEWEICGDASFCEADQDGGDTVCVNADWVCPGSFELRVTVRAPCGECSTCCFEVEIDDYEPPVIDCPCPPRFECDVPWEFCVTATDNCDDVEITCEICDLYPPDADTFTCLGDGCWSLTLSESCWGSLCIRATDFCGNVSCCYIDFDMECINEGTEGCTPGYWKQSQHFGNWVGYAPSDLFSSVFDNAFPGMTLLEVLQQGGGGLIALGRHTVAALLNAASDIDYPLSPQQVIDMFNDVFPGPAGLEPGDYEALKDQFEEYNSLGCPLGRAECPGGADPPKGKKTGQASGLLDATNGCGPVGLIVPLLTATGLLGLRLRTKSRRPH